MVPLLLLITFLPIHIQNFLLTATPILAAANTFQVDCNQRSVANVSGVRRDSSCCFASCCAFHPCPGCKKHVALFTDALFNGQGMERTMCLNLFGEGWTSCQVCYWSWHCGFCFFFVFWDWPTHCIWPAVNRGTQRLQNQSDKCYMLSLVEVEGFFENYELWEEYESHESWVWWFMVVYNLQLFMDYWSSAEVLLGKHVVQWFNLVWLAGSHLEYHRWNHGGGLWRVPWQFLFDSWATTTWPKQK